MVADHEHRCHARFQDQAAGRRPAGDPSQGLCRDHGGGHLPRGRRHQGQLLPSLQEQGRPGAQCHRALGCHDGELLCSARPITKHADPLQRLLGYVDFRGAILTGELPDYTCLLGTLVQETYATHPGIRAACDRGLSRHIALLTRDIEAAKKRYAPKARWSAESVGYFIQAALQGSFIFAKAKQSPAVIEHNLAHLRRYLKTLFTQSRDSERKESLAMATTNTVRLHRVLAAKPDKVYRAFLEPDAMARWLPPNGFTGKVHQHGCEGRRPLQDVVHQLQHRPEPLLRR